MRYLMKQHQSWLMIIVLSWLTVLTLPIIHATDDDNQKKLLADTSNKDVASSRLLGPLSREATESKRASFMASRGKKETEPTNQLANNLQSSDNSNQFDAKRASSFMPMRGRKEYYPQWFVPNEESYYDESKRAAFIGMRGRKNSEPNNGYLEPYADVYKSELDAMKRASFMAMRGRKSSGDYGYGQQEYYVPTQQISNALSQIKIPNWMEGEPAISDNSELMDKRARAFYGARGKRSVSDNGSDDHHRVNSEHVDINRELHNNGHNENFFATRG